MVVERVGGVLQSTGDSGIVPGLWRVEVRVEDGEEAELVSKIVDLAFGQSGGGAVEVARGSSRRMTLRIGGYPREIAEARAEAMKARALLGGMRLDVSIRKI
jgi:hypothetical protein